MIRRSVACLVAIACVLMPASAAPKKTTASKKPTTTSKPAATSKTAKVEKPSSPGIAEPFAVESTGGPPMIRGESCIVLDARTGEILHEKNADNPRPVASTQKLLTALIVAESGNLDEIVTIQASDTWAEPSKLYLKPGEKYERFKLLQILLVKSMNDVARCLARDNAGNIDQFAAKMNAKARLLGMSNSNFVNPNGLPAAGQYSTARDMAKVAMAAYRSPVIRNIIRLKTLTWSYTDGRTRTFENTNRVLQNYALCNGMKTGYTEAAGHCLISSASFGGRDVIVVVLGDNKQVWNDSYRLLNWGLSS